MLLEGKRLLITGVLTPQSIAFAVAEAAQNEGAEILLTGFGRSQSLTERSAKRLPKPADVLELDVTNSAHFSALTQSLRSRWRTLDGALHAIACAPAGALAGDFLNSAWGTGR